MDLHIRLVFLVQFFNRFNADFLLFLCQASSSTIKQAKVRQKPASSGKGATPRSPSLSREANKQVLSASESVGELDCPTVESFQADTISSTPPTDSHSSPDSVKQNVVFSKKEGCNLPKHRISENVKVIKDPKSGGRPKVEAQNMKRAGLTSGSGIARLAVVAS